MQCQVADYIVYAISHRPASSRFRLEREGSILGSFHCQTDVMTVHRQCFYTRYTDAFEFGDFRTSFGMLLKQDTGAR